MSLIVNFADGFTSASAPTITGGSGPQETYVISNNISSPTNITGLVFSSTSFRSFFANFRLTRTDTVTSVEQTGTLIGHYDGSAWTLTFGNYDGDSIVASSLVAVTDVVFTITSGGQVQYTSGNMVGGTHTGSLKLAITRISE
jgi:hypothetical protein